MICLIDLIKINFFNLIVLKNNFLCFYVLKNFKFKIINPYMFLYLIKKFFYFFLSLNGNYFIVLLNSVFEVNDYLVKFCDKLGFIYSMYCRNFSFKNFFDKYILKSVFYIKNKPNKNIIVILYGNHFPVNFFLTIKKFGFTLLLITNYYCNICFYDYIILCNINNYMNVFYIFNYFKYIIFKFNICLNFNKNSYYFLYKNLGNNLILFIRFFISCRYLKCKIYFKYLLIKLFNYLSKNILCIYILNKIINFYNVFIKITGLVYFRIFSDYSFLVFKNSYVLFFRFKIKFIPIYRNLLIKLVKILFSRLLKYENNLKFNNSFNNICCVLCFLNFFCLKNIFFLF